MVATPFDGAIILRLMPPRYASNRCKDCGRGGTDGVYVSTRKLCLDCGIKRYGDNLTQIATKQGPYFERYATRLERAARSMRRRAEGKSAY